MKRIITRQQLIELAQELGVRPDWHEPDEQEVTATVEGRSFDNASFWGNDQLMEFARRGTLTDAVNATEMYVTINQDGQPVAEVNLAMLFAWATGYQD